MVLAAVGEAEEARPRKGHSVTIEIPILIRPMDAGDAPIVFDSWARSMCDELGIKDEDEVRRFVRGQKPVIAALLERGRNFVAAPRKDPSRCLGWICTELPDVLHFVFVKKPDRCGKIATRLVEHAGLPKVARASHSTSWGLPRVARLFEKLTHDPALGAT